MISLTTIGLVSLTSLVLAITPGPDMIYIATRSIAQGRSAGIVSALGVHTGVFVHTFAAALGLSALIAASALAFSIVKYAGAAYLIYLGVRTLLSNPETLEVTSNERSKLGEIFRQGLITNVLNPEVVLFFLAFLPQFVDPAAGNATTQIFLLGLVMVVVTLPVDIAVALLGGKLGVWLRARRSVQRASKWVTGLVYIGLGVGTALHGRRT